MENNSNHVGAEKARWTLTDLYPDLTTPAGETAILADVATVTQNMVDFCRKYRGNLAETLPAALPDYIEIVRQLTKLNAVPFLYTTLDNTDAALRKIVSRVDEALARAQAENLTFFNLEIMRIPAVDYQQLLTDELVRQHQPMLDHLRKLARHALPDEVEQTLTLRSPYGAGEWADMMREIQSSLLFAYQGKTLSLEELLNTITESRDAAERATLQKILNDGLAGRGNAYFQARALNAKIGEAIADYTARGYPHAMAAKNLTNRVDDATVTALHEAVGTTGAELCQRFYRLKGRLLGFKADVPLKWSDRNAQLPFAPDRKVSWDDACMLVSQAYHAFSPQLGELVDQVFAKGWVDALPVAGKKSGGAFDYTMPLPDGVRSYVMMNYLGSPRNVMTLAHELGHAVHGLLAYEAQGPLQWGAPMVYAETASVFGEMLTFEHLLTIVSDDKERLALLIDKINDALNTVVRQISFSEFEQGLYARRAQGKLTEADFDTLWLDITEKFYGPSGAVFTYENINHVWSYIHHFLDHASFYVYAYAFGELFTQSLMASRGRVGSRFPDLYLNLLRAGGTKGAVDLLAPFGLDPTAPDFWRNGLTGSLGRWISDAEDLADRLGY